MRPKCVCQELVSGAVPWGSSHLSILQSADTLFDSFQSHSAHNSATLETNLLKYFNTISLDLCCFAQELSLPCQMLFWPAQNGCNLLENRVVSCHFQQLLCEDPAWMQCILNLSKTQHGTVLGVCHTALWTLSAKDILLFSFYFPNLVKLRATWSSEGFPRSWHGGWN